MEPIKLKATDRSPEVDFDFATNIYVLRGMCFMEDVSGFFEPLMAPLKQHFEALEGAEVRFDFALSYFNSSAARIVLSLFDLLDAAAERGNSVTIQWHHEDDEDMAEQGEEFGEDLVHATFEIVDSGGA
ncbi:MAG: DUF1987 domain-containing protein [Rhodospirillaceae bacterium]|nr:DUF1987 domain-containing protein [Rhodospirillaceae bacterium]